MELNEEDLTKISIELRRKLFDDLSNFWADKKGLPMDQVFFINSVVISSLVSQTAYMLFKKNIGTSKPAEYIDQICKFAKEQLKSGAWIMETGIQ
jgi:hypothetical protein